MTNKVESLNTLYINNLEVRIEGREIVRGITLLIRPGEIHALMGPNGTGKSSMALALMGHPRYRDTTGSVTIGSVDLLTLSPQERAKAGLFLGMQYPSEIPGVPLTDFIRTAHTALGRPKTSLRAFRKALEENLRKTGMDSSFAARYLNEGFSGGEKKRSEIVQARMLKPAFAVFDEIDSGLDVDALRHVGRSIDEMRREGSGVLLITHYSRILTHVHPDFVHIMAEGRIARSGEGPALAQELESKGYEALLGKEAALS